MKKKNVKQGIFAAFLAASIVFSMMPTTPFADEVQSTENETIPEETAFSKSEVVDGVTVTVTADKGVFPEGSTLNVKKVEEPSVVDAFENMVEEKQPETSEDAIVQEIRTEMENLAVQGLDDLGMESQNEQELKVFDITITDKNGAEVQPDTSKGKATVSFTGIDTDSNTDEIQVYHANEDMKDIQALETDADVDAGYAEVVAEHFSYYCLSTLKTGTEFEVHKLTSTDKELTSGIYYVDEDLTFTGADSTSSSEAGGNGLKIADGATVYIYIAEGKTLTATGGNGYAATNGANGTDGDITTSGSGSASGLKLTFPGKAQQAAGGTGGTGATGGGAGILVPANSKLVCIGQGNINATGGNGGNAGNGGAGGKTHVRYQSSYTAYNSSNTVYTDYNTYAGNICKMSVTGIATERYAASVHREAPGAGGGAGGGAAGGGAGIGSNGASGNTGVAGANSSATGSKNYNFTKNSASDSNKYSAQNKVAGSVGSIYINCNYNATGGNGGTAGSQGAASEVVSGNYQTYYGDSINGTLYTYTFYFMDGQVGGGGAAGGNGAKIGTGGAGGVSGMGGDSGSSTHSDSNSSASASYCTSQIGANGSKAGADGTGNSSTLGDTQYPYNTITFTNAKSNATQNYYITKQTQITVPDYEVEAGKYFVGWKVTTPATVLPSSFGEQTCGLETAGTVYQAGDKITVTGVYGNVTLEAVVVTHTHSWNYEVDSTDKNKITAYCSETENSEYCAYQKENALTLTLSATNAIYSGKAYTGASMEDDITSVTKETANIEYYQVDTENTSDGGTKLSSAPTDAGYYYASVTLGGATAKAAFKIEKKSIKDAVISLTPGDVLHTGTEVTQIVGSVTLDGVTLTASAYEIADSSTFKATDFGVYTITVNGVGNYKDSASVKWKIKDENPPTGEITIEKNNWKSFLSDATFGIFFKATQTVTINASDTGSGVDKVYYYNSNVILSLDEVKALADSKWKLINNGGSYDIDPENQYVVYAKITDKSGNVTYISSEGFVIDKTAPTITGVKDQGAYCEAVTFTATDAYLKTVTVDGTAVTLSADGSYTIQANDKAHTIVAEDKAGNTTTVQVTVYDGHSWKEPVFTWSADYSGATATITCAHDASHTQTETCTVKKEITKQASGTQKGEITYTAAVTMNGKTYEDTKTQATVVAGSEEIGTNGGKITTEIIVADDMPKTEIKNLTIETAKSLLTPEELAQVENGAEITIYLEANSLTEDAVSTEDKNYVESKLDGIADKLMQSEGLTSKKQVTTGIQYIDLSLYKRIGNGTATKLKSTGQKELEITVDIPANLKSDNSKRTYYIIRVHETNAGAEVDILPTTKSGDTLTFTTDRFSTYAIAYAEPNGYILPTNGGGSGSNGNNGNNNSGSTNNSDTGNSSNNTGSVSITAADSQKEAQSATAPKTGDSARTSIGIVLLVLAVAVFAQIFRKKKKQ